MVDNKKVAAGVAAVAIVGTVAALALRGDEEPVEEGAPEGEVSLEITEIQGYTLDDVQGVWGVGATINVNGLCTAGFPLPEMVVELYDNGSLRKTMTVPTVVLGTTYKLTDTMGLADVGGHIIYGRMVLSNELGSYEFTSPSQTFDIGEVPPGEVTIDVTLTPG